MKIQPDSKIMFVVLAACVAACAAAPATVISPDDHEVGEWFVMKDAELSTRSWAVSRETGERVEVTSCEGGPVRIIVTDRCTPGSTIVESKSVWVNASVDGPIPEARGGCVAVQMRSGLCLAARREGADPGTQWWIKTINGKVQWCDMAPERDNGCSPQAGFAARVE